MLHATQYENATEEARAWLHGRLQWERWMHHLHDAAATPQEEGPTDAGHAAGPDSSPRVPHDDVSEANGEHLRAVGESALRVGL